MSARFTALSFACVLLGGLAPIRPAILSGCGSNLTTTAFPDDSGFGSAGSVLTHARADASLSGGSGGTGSDSGSASGSGSGSGPASGSGSGSGPGSGSASGSASGSGSVSGSGSPGPTRAGCGAYAVMNCGMTPCDLRSNTCCAKINLTGRCIPGANATCASNEVTGHCSTECDCPEGKVCCGVANTVAGVIQFECQAVPDGGNCSPNPATSTMSSAQFCKPMLAGECKNGQACLNQTCSSYNLSLNICGLQAAFGCH
jgi:hypothetical protein